MFRRRKMENHYEFAEWADFARGTAGSKTREKVQAHLGSGCKECGELARFFSELVQRAASDAAYHIPDYALRNIRTIFALQQPQEVRLLPRTVARLIYDSFREPLLAGVRSQQSTAHQLMYVAGPYSVDLRLEQEQGAPRVRLTGQIANRKRASGVPEVPVFVLSRDLVIGKTSTNKFGEFAVEYPPSNKLRLFAPIPGENHIEVRFGAASSRRRGATKK
jgi:hypothetical protein